MLHIRFGISLNYYYSKTEKHIAEECRKDVDDKIMWNVGLKNVDTNNVVKVRFFCWLIVRVSLMLNYVTRNEDESKSAAEMLVIEQSSHGWHGCYVLRRTPFLSVMLCLHLSDHAMFHRIANMHSSIQSRWKNSLCFPVSGLMDILEVVVHFVASLGAVMPSSHSRLVTWCIPRQYSL